MKFVNLFIYLYMEIDSCLVYNAKMSVIVINNVVKCVNIVELTYS